MKTITSVAKKVFWEFIYGGHLLSLGASAIIWTIAVLLDLPTSIQLLAIPYLISQVVYAYNHFKEIEYDKDSNPERTNYVSQQKRWGGLLLAFYSILLIISVAFTNLPTILLSLIIVLGGILYTDVFKGLASRRFTGFKNFYTSSFGALAVLLVPSFHQIEIGLFFIYLMLFVFMRLIVNSTFFDIKDIESDSQRGLKTFAVKLGKTKTLLLLHTINLSSTIPLVLAVNEGNTPRSYLLLGLLSLYSFYYLTHAFFLEGRGLRNVSYIIVDAEYVFWPIIVLVVKSLS